MYQLYWAPGTAAMAPQTMLEEIGAPYQAKLLDLEAREHHGPAYKRLNPTSRIPTLVDGNFVIFETAAICQYLCDKHPDAKLAPPMGTEARGRFYQWLTFMTNTVQAGMVDWWHPDFTFSDKPRQDAFKAETERKLGLACDAMNGAIGANASMAGGQYTVCDIYLAMLTRWSRFFAKPMWLWPNIKRIAGQTYVRPAFQRMMGKQGIVWPENWPKT